MQHCAARDAAAFGPVDSRAAVTGPCPWWPSRRSWWPSPLGGHNDLVRDMGRPASMGWRRPQRN